MKTQSEKEKEKEANKKLIELVEHDLRIAQLEEELHEYAQRHGYSDEDLHAAVCGLMVETLSLMSKRGAREVLRRLEEGADGMREFLIKKRQKRPMAA